MRPITQRTFGKFHSRFNLSRFQESLSAKSFFSYHEWHSICGNFLRCNRWQSEVMSSINILLTQNDNKTKENDLRKRQRKITSEKRENFPLFFAKIMTWWTMIEHAKHFYSFKKWTRATTTTTAEILLILLIGLCCEVNNIISAPRDNAKIRKKKVSLSGVQC